MGFVFDASHAFLRSIKIWRINPQAMKSVTRIRCRAFSFRRYKETKPCKSQWLPLALFVQTGYKSLLMLIILTHLTPPNLQRHYPHSRRLHTHHNRHPSHKNLIHAYILLCPLQ